MTWTLQDQSHALEEGWGIFNTGSDAHPHFEIQRHDEAEIFSGDEMAQTFVKQAAKHGHPLAVKALADLGAGVLEIGDNLDAINDPAVLYRYSTGYQQLADYAAWKQAAVARRLDGNIPAALTFERKCNSLYEALPSWAKTW